MMPATMSFTGGSTNLPERDPCVGAVPPKIVDQPYFGSFDDDGNFCQMQSPYLLLKLCTDRQHL